MVSSRKYFSRLSGYEGRVLLTASRTKQKKGRKIILTSLGTVKTSSTCVKQGGSQFKQMDISSEVQLCHENPKQVT